MGMDTLEDEQRAQCPPEAALTRQATQRMAGLVEAGVTMEGRGPDRYMYEAASVLMTRCKQPSKLRAWGVAIARRRGAKRARVAVARKLAVIMHRMWVSGGQFETGVERPELAAA